MCAPHDVCLSCVFGPVDVWYADTIQVLASPTHPLASKKTLLPAIVVGVPLTQPKRAFWPPHRAPLWAGPPLKSPGGAAPSPSGGG